MNPKICLRLLGWICSILIIFPAYSAGQIQYNISFDINKLNLSLNTENDVNYTEILYDGLINDGKIGHPALPVMIIPFSVPYDAYNFNVIATVKDSVGFDLDYPVMPFYNKFSNDSICINDSIYSFNSFGPDCAVSVLNDGYIDGDNHVVVLEIRPISYNPVLSKGRLYLNLDIMLSYDCGNGINHLKIKPILRYNANGRDESIRQVENLVVNSSLVRSNLAPLSIQPSSFNSSVSYYEYCVVTSRELAPAFQKLVAYKRLKGYDAGVVCVEDILENSNFQNGDIISNINDNAGKIRAYLSAAFECRVLKYVLLGGKEPNVPIRYGLDNSRSFLGEIPTDLYFSEFNGNWNLDNDSIYGESEGDAVDLCPDVCIGRLLCTTKDEVINYTNKLIQYETNPGNGDYSYLSNVISVHSEEFAENANYVSEQFSECNVVIEEDNYPQGSDVINLINENPCGMMLFHGHGNPGGITLCTNNGSGSSGVNALDRERKYLLPEEGNGFDCLTNKYYPSVCYSMSCVNIPFDVWREYSFIYNLGESYTLGKDYGGVAYVGNTREVIGAYAMVMEDVFLSNLRVNAGIGNNMNVSKMFLYQCPGQIFANNLLGDPEFNVWLNEPMIIDSVNVVREDSQIKIQIPSDYPNLKIGYCTPQNISAKLDCSLAGEYVIEANSNASIIIYGENYLPQILPLVIQNQVYECSQYINSSNVKMGNNVDPNRLIGPVLIGNNSELYIDATENVLIEDGVEVYSGSSLIIKSQKKVQIGGGLIKQGAIFKVEAPEIEISDKFEVEVGAIIELKTF